MAKADRAAYAHSDAAHTHKGYAKRMCDHVAMALVVYTLMLIFVTAPAMHDSDSIFPYFLLVALVAIAIPALRNLERKWQALENSELAVSGLDTRFSFDRTILWAGAMLVPVGLYFLITALAAIF